MILTAQQLVTEIHSNELFDGVDVPNPRDSRYYCPSYQWLQDFGKWFVNQAFHKKWIENTFDCDDFAIRAVDRATDALGRRTDLGLVGHTFCYAEIFFNGSILGATAKGKHAINIVRCQNDWYYFEPQTGQSMALADVTANGTMFNISWIWL